ncbi:hypothetical protein C9374_006018 [Naegleria lovaniensis]|uniref:Vacuolar protein sorting-associated protein 16 homolog n=1 Tax=Naegleria lovaniensis TaxID=51637 RepID=A0AA88KHC6_NAELO|nr:uncharacterized protein C9374_006018 [Naegleria lovaniensis]KAG2381634.1 hypothetical protein C9374_006018 [Naegleria lovaniensis]
MSAEWVQLGKGKKGLPVYYRKKEIYTMQWNEDHINLSECLVAAANFGGPIALTRDPKKLLRYKGTDTKQYIFVFSSSGKRISKFEWNSQLNKSLQYIGWTHDESLICVTEDAHVFVFDIFGKQLLQFGFVEEVKNAGILKVKHWETGVAILTKDFKIWVVSDLDAPFCEQFASMNISTLDFNDEQEIGMCILQPNVTASGDLEIIISVPQSPTVFIVTSEECHDVGLDNGPFPKICASPSGEALATFNESGSLWVVKSDFTDKHAEFDTNGSSNPPTQIAWCGEDSVCLYWEQLNNREGNISLLLMIGPNGDYSTFHYDTPIHLVTEIDGKNASSIKNIRSIKANLKPAVKACLEASANEFNSSLQKSLLRAASYGKSFCDDFDHSEFVSTCKTLRVMNAVRDPSIGIPITLEQYKRLTPKVLIDRLVNRMQHLLAYRICTYLKIKPNSVLVHWACSKVLSNEDDGIILESIDKKLSECEGIPFSSVASTAYSVGKKNLAIQLLEREERASEQVPLLLNMGETKNALRKAIISGETDLVYLVLLHMKKNMEVSHFFSIINEKGFRVARNLLVTYCKEQDIDFLKVFFHALDKQEEAAAMNVLESFAFEDEPQAHKKILNQAKELYNKKKDYQLDSKLCEEQIKLLQMQRDFDKNLPSPVFVGLSVGDTIYHCLLTGNKQSKRVKKEFQVSDKKYWWIKIAALSKLGKWNKLEKFSKKKSPIGYRPFVEACLQQKNKLEAAKYIPRVSDIWEKIELYVELQLFKEAMETAFAQKDPDMLRWIRTKTQHAQTKATIDDLLNKL